MFAAMCENTEFFKERMLLFVALAPVVSVKNLESEFLRDLNENEQAYNGLKALGPEILWKANADNIVSDFVVHSSLGVKVQGNLLSQVSDSNPSLIDQDALQNLFKFYPAGTSFQCIDHFKQLFNHG